MGTNRSRRGLNGSGEQRQQRTLSCSIRANNAKRFPRHHREADVIQRTERFDVFAAPMNHSKSHSLEATRAPRQAVVLANILNFNNRTLCHLTGPPMPQT